MQIILSFLALVCLLPAIALSAPGQLFERIGAQPRADPGSGERAATFFTNWREGSGNFQCTSGQGGSYSARWSGQGGFVCGKGYNPGNWNRVFRYNGTYNATGPGYLTLYGWTRNPLIEYYIIDSYDILAPGEPWTLRGNFTFEEGSYDLYTSTRVNKPSIEGTRTFQQYWSVRTEKRVGGQITVGKHYDAWRALGLPFGYHDYQVLATEGFTNGNKVCSGTSNLTVD